MIPCARHCYSLPVPWPPVSCNLIGPRADVLPIRPDCHAAENELTDILVALDRELEISGTLPVTVPWPARRWTRDSLCVDWSRSMETPVPAGRRSRSSTRERICR